MEAFPSIDGWCMAQLPDTGWRSAGLRRGRRRLADARCSLTATPMGKT